MCGLELRGAVERALRTVDISMVIETTGRMSSPRERKKREKARAWNSTFNGYRKK